MKKNTRLTPWAAWILTHAVNFISGGSINSERSQAAMGKTPQPPAPPGWVELILWAVLFLLSVQYLLAIGHLPILWYDEAYMLEPAWRIATTGHCVSTIVPDMPENLPFGMNYPLFILALSGWIKMFGLRLAAIRWLPAILLTSAGAIAIAALRRMNLLRSRAQILLLIILWLLTHPAFYAFHQDRPESLTLVLVAAGLYASTWGNKSWALAVLFFVSLLLPSCGLYMIFPVAIAAALAFGGRVYNPRQLLAVMLGIFCGGVGFYLINQLMGSWPSFQREAARTGGLSILNRLSRILAGNGLPITLVQPFAGLPLVLVLGWLGWHRNKKIGLTSVGVTVYAVAAVLSIGILARFNLWYGWLYLLPLMVVFVMFIFDRPAAPAWFRFVILISLTFTLLYGNVSRCLSYSHLVFWKETNPQMANQLLEGVAKNGDVVMGDDSTFVALRPLVKRFYSLYFYGLSVGENSIPMEKALPRTAADSITLIVCNKTEDQFKLVQPLEQWCGGSWVEVPIPSCPTPRLLHWMTFLHAKTTIFDLGNYRVFRRVPDASPAAIPK